jgi:DNA helicase-2/ATP-dependent DNA helicase PcrA
MVTRTLYILLRGKAEPHEILLTTFTEKAAFELRDRVSQIARKVGYTGQINLMKIGTIHSICNHFIGRYLKHTPLRKGYRVLDELTQIFFIYENFDEIADKGGDYYFGRWGSKWEAIKRIVPYFNKITEELIDINELKKSDKQFLRKVALSYEKYTEKLFSNNRVDFSHLQKIFLGLLNNPDIGQKIKEQFKYIMVDEYQDTNYVQEQILLKLAEPENNIAVVGDEDQSIYRFRGATVRNILEFPQHFEYCKKIT